MDRLNELVTQLEGLRSEIAELDALAEPTEEQTARFAVALDEFDTAKAEHDALSARAARVEAVRTAALNPANVIPGAARGPEVIVRNDPFENLDAVRAGHVSAGDLVARARNVIEDVESFGTSDSARQAAANLLQHAVDPDGVARYMLLTGSPAYRSAFEKILRNPQNFQGALTAEEADAMRTAMSTTVGNGGYAIPFLLDPTFILMNDGAANPFRQIATIKQGTSNKWNGVSSAGVTAEWKSEGSAAADASPTLTQPSIEAFLADAYVFGSYEVFQDTNLAADLPMLIADAKDRLEADAFAVGSGSGAPKGVVTAVTAVTASRVSPTTAGTFTSASRSDVDKVIVAVPPRYRSKSSWVANYSVLDTIRQMDTYGGGAFWANLSANLPEQLLGRPVYEASAMTATVTTGSNILLAGDFSQYYIYDRIGMSVEYIPNVMDTSTGRPTGQRGWFATWRVGGDVVNTNAFRVLKL